MTDGQDPDLFEHFSIIAQRLGVYTAKHYAEIIQHLVRQWELDSLCGLTGEAAAAQDYLCSLGPRYARLAERSERRLNGTTHRCGLVGSTTAASNRGRSFCFYASTAFRPFLRARPKGT